MSKYEFYKTDYEKAYRDLYRQVAQLLIEYGDDNKTVLLAIWDEMRREFPNA